MKIYNLIFILICNFIFIKNDYDFDHGYYSNPDNINIESIHYELTYNNYSVVKVTIKTYDELEGDISFVAYLKSHVEEKEYKLNCTVPVGLSLEIISFLSRGTMIVPEILVLKPTTSALAGISSPI